MAKAYRMQNMFNLKSKIMKKVFALMLLLATTVCFYSCSEDDEESNEIPLSALIGTWKGVAVKVENDWIDITEYPYSSKLGFSATFNIDGSYYGRGALGNGHGTYSLDGNRIKTYVGGELYLTYYIKSWTYTTAELTITDDSGSIDARVIKL